MFAAKDASLTDDLKYHMLISEEKLESNLSRLVVIVWVFVVLILTSSYTASLTSMLTFQQFQPTVTSVQDLLRNGHFVGYQRGSTVKYWLEEMGFHKKNLLGYGTVEEYAEALQMGSENGGVSAIFDENPYLKIFLSKYCEGYTMVGPTYRLGGFGFVSLFTNQSGISYSYVEGTVFYFIFIVYFRLSL
jgi:hypothetical protein